MSCSRLRYGDRVRVLKDEFGRHVDRDAEVVEESRYGEIRVRERATGRERTLRCEDEEFGWRSEW